MNHLRVQPFSENLPEPVRVTVSSVDDSPYLHDESKLSAQGAFEVCRPQSVDEVRGALRHCLVNWRPLTVSAARTGLTGACLPEEGALIVSLERLKGVVRVEHANEPEVTVLSGTTLAELNAYLDEHHPTLFFPVDPTETGASLGGMISMNAGGARSLAYGSVRGWVLGLQVELPTGGSLALRRGQAIAADGTFVLDDGEVQRTLRAEPIPKPATKNTIGYSYGPVLDAVDLFIGAEGTLGIVTEITLRLAARPTHRLSALAFFGDADAAFDCVERVRSDRSLPAIAVEFLDERSIQLAQKSPKRAGNRVFESASGRRAAVFIELATSDDDVAASLDEQLVEILVETGGDDVETIVGTDDRTLREMKEFRHAVPESINRTIAQRKKEFPELHKIATDMAVPNEHLRWVFALYRDTLSARGLDFAIFGHAGSNHFHVNMLPRNGDELRQAKELYFEWASAIVARGGSVAAEHGIGKLKRRFLAVQYSEEVLENMRTIKRFFDPTFLLNRGVLLPDAP